MMQLWTSLPYWQPRLGLTQCHWQKIEEPHNSNFVVSHFDQDHKLWTTMNISNKYDELSTPKKPKINLEGRWWHMTVTFDDPTTEEEKITEPRKCGLQTQSTMIHVVDIYNIYENITVMYQILALSHCIFCRKWLYKKLCFLKSLNGSWAKQDWLPVYVHFAQVTPLAISISFVNW